ncbi:MAG: protein-L-isoaspartate O-methyltransferase [Lautropia sp.]
MDVETARFNMIEQQIRPWNVLDQDVLDALMALRREEFVAPAFRGLAFADVEIPISPGGEASGESMFTPKVEARLLQALAPRKHETALEIGTGSGYGTALLSLKTREVITYEIDARIFEFANQNLQRAGIVNVSLHSSDGAKIAGSQRYDIVVLSGSVQHVPQAWLERLAVGGRMAAIVGDAPAMKALLILREDERRWRTTELFETSCKRLAGFPAREPFRF